MKKIWILLLSIFVMYGCGSGGAGSTSGTPTGSPGSSTASGETRDFTLTLLNDGVAASSTSRRALAIASGSATSARVVIRKVETVSVPEYEVDDEGNLTDVIIGYHNVDTETYRRVDDYEFSSATISVTAPVSADAQDTYTFDVLTFIKGTPNTMLHFGHQDGVDTRNGSLVLNIQDICADADPGASLNGTGYSGTVVMQIPDKIISEQAYNVTADAKTPVRRGYYELGIALPSDTTPAAPLIIYGTTRLTAPTTFISTDTSLNFTVKYFISDDMLDPTKTPAESYKNWVRTYPNNVNGVTGETLASTFAPLMTIAVPNP